MMLFGSELHVALTNLERNKEIELANVPENRKLRLETLVVVSDEDTTSPKIGGYAYSKYPYSIALKENGITKALIAPKSPDFPRNLARFKVDFAFPTEVEGRVTVVFSCLAPIKNGDVFNIHLQIVTVEINADETIR